jgi:hypothetical protein
MAEPNFGAILDRPSSEIERPKPLPVGHYLTVTQGLPRFDKSTKKQTEFAEFTLKFLQPLDDVDPEELKTFGELTDKTMTHTFYLTEKSAYRLKEFMVEDLGIEEADTLRAMIDETPNRQVVVQIKHTPSDDGKSMYANIASTQRAE